MVLWLGTGEAYGLLAELLAAEYGLPGLPELERQAGDKPFFPHRPDLHFNLSHSGDLALCGVGAAPLGVDLEMVRPRRAGLARYICSPEEYAWYEELGGDWESLYTIWTLKEARVKCTGEGLRQRPETIAVPRLGPGQTGELEGLIFRSYAGNGWRGAVCCVPPEEPPERILEHHP
ncbi:4'-phosphopantetheinyl transferase superfamily protein [Flavonifractor sp. An306]|uniref:4'-phosphopantetheinyl transferase family protein n=1 Tax=Flavonifractor sp. An306 TaxID=1965629 RepID=UPI000B3ABB83|nr:4'-phosphopantetheinyl transferase superfamily protein [Flavonifractor sp. An306]OUO44747.1 4-phosphopantetheinyl transferase [Flavonifractor sp. An306]